MNKLLNQGFIDQKQLNENIRLSNYSLTRIKDLKTFIEDNVSYKYIVNCFLDSGLEQMIKNNKAQLDLLRFIEERMNKISNQAYIDNTQLTENIQMSQLILSKIQYLKTLIEHNISDTGIAESLNSILDHLIKINESQIELSKSIALSNGIIGV
jgi:hypothetical protein